MNQLFILLWQFAKRLWLYNFIFTLISISLMLRTGLFFLPVIVVFKLAGYASATFFQTYFSSQTYCYYRNAGYSVGRLYSYTYIIDFLLFILLAAIALFSKSLLYAKS